MGCAKLSTIKNPQTTKRIYLITNIGRGQKGKNFTPELTSMPIKRITGLFVCRAKDVLRCATQLVLDVEGERPPVMI